MLADKRPFIQMHHSVFLDIEMRSSSVVTGWAEKGLCIAMNISSVLFPVDTVL
jgi:hypothetical protein